MNPLPCDSAELARTLFEDSSDALFLFDPVTEQILDVNTAAQKLTSLTHADLVQQPIRFWFRADDPSKALPLGDSCTDCEGFQLRQRDDDLAIPVKVTIAHLSAKPALGLVRARDLRDERAAREGAHRREIEAELTRMLASVSDCVWSAELAADGAWQIRYCSPVIETITGWPATQVVGVLDRWLDIIHPDDRAYYHDLLTNLVQRVEPAVLEYRIMMPDGAIRWVRDSLHPRRLANGRLRIDAVCSDITQHRTDADRLRESEQQYRRLVETSNDLIWSIDAEGRWAYINRQALQAIGGYEPEEVLGRLMAEFIAPECVQRDTRVAERVLLGHPSYRHETILLRKDGTRVHLSVNAIPLCDDEGRPMGITGTATDITRWKDAEAGLLESRRRFEIFMDAIPLVGFMKDSEGRYLYVNHAFQETFGRSADQVVGKRDIDFWPMDIAAALRDVDLRVMAGTQRLEVREQVPTPDGTLREWWVAKFPLRDAHGNIFVGGIGLDLTARTQIEDALRCSEERYRQLWQRNLAAIVRASLTGRILDCNESFARLFGYGSREEMFTRSTKEFYFDLGVREEFLARLREHQNLTNYEMQMRRADGTAIWVLENVTLLFENGEEILEGTLIDISDRKRIEEALRASEANYRTLINHLDQGIFLKDRELRYVTVNPIFCAGVGRSEEELRGKTISELYPDHLTEKARSIETAVLAEGRAIETEDVLNVAGRPRSVRISRTPVKDIDGAVVGVLGICWDVTEQRELEAQLRHVQKMDAIGQLAGGIAHDFNNLLTIMLGNLSCVLTQNQDWYANLELLKNAEKAGLRAAELTQTLLGFSHRAALASVPFNVNEAIGEVVRLTRSTLPANIEVEIRAQPQLWLVQADPGQINQILTNLTLNARDAMPRGGTIIYQTSHFVPDEEFLASHVEASPGEFVRLRVRDNGQGIPAEVRQRIFEPFFTTKEKGKGTGLGLAIVFGIAKQHRGWVVCETEPGHGTTFDIFLPRCEAIVLTEPPVAAADTVVRETILMVDDEPMIRQLGATILSKAGFQVLAAENGAVALEMVHANPGKIVLIILDAVMPRLSGRETLRELTRIAPDIGVLFSSGYSTEQMSFSEFPQVRDFLPKPYRAEQLIQKVSEIIGASRK